ncbi:MAG: carbohydrate kinase [Tahibacter sp.]
MRTVTCFGEALIDFLALPDPADGQARQYARYAGGAPANVAAAIAKLGGEVAFVGMLGLDAFGDFLLASLRQAGVHTDFVVRTDAAPTALAFVELDAGGERRFSFYRPPAADLLFRPAHFRDACFSHTSIFHICSNSLTDAAIAETTLAGLARARAAGALVSFDINLRSALWPKDTDPRTNLWNALRETDLVKLCAAEFAFLATTLGDEETVLSELWRGRSALVVVTDGASPVRYFTPTRAGEVPAFAVHAIDTNAAGDAFIGGLLQWLAQHHIDAATLDRFSTDPRQIETALRYASACGAIAVTRHGAFAALPLRAEVDAFLEAHPC